MALALRVLLVAVYLLINGIVLDNAHRHNPWIGYDSFGHIGYMLTLSQGRLPTPQDTNEFFSAPLPYAPGALAMRLGMEERRACKLAQYAQVGFSCVLTFFLILLCRQMQRGERDDVLPLLALLCLGMIPTYYRTFAMVRGEPLLATLGVVMAWLAVTIFARDDRRRGVAWAVVLGLVIGAAILARQWGFFLVPAVVLLAFWRAVRDRAAMAWVVRTLAIAAVVSILTGGWYYLHLQRTYGSITAFNREPVAASSRPATFYVGFNLPAMIENPIANQETPRRLPQILYADLWGDFWMNFLVHGIDARGHYMQGPILTHRGPSLQPAETNRPRMKRYLGRVLTISLLPTAVLFVGIGAGFVSVWWWLRCSRDVDPARATLAFGVAVIVVTCSGYLWFIIRYSDGTADTIKASYLLQTIPFAALLTAAFLHRLFGRRPRVAGLLVFVLAGTWCHNARAMRTRFPADFYAIDDTRPRNLLANRPSREVLERRERRAARDAARAAAAATSRAATQPASAPAAPSPAQQQQQHPDR